MIVEKGIPDYDYPPPAYDTPPLSNGVAAGEGGGAAGREKGSGGLPDEEVGEEDDDPDIYGFPRGCPSSCRSHLLVSINNVPLGPLFGRTWMDETPQTWFTRAKLGDSPHQIKRDLLA